jgi:hypothetical protein
MFEFVKDLTGSPLVVTNEFLMTNAEAVARGEALILSSGRLTKAAAGGPVFAIAQEAKAAGTDIPVNVAPVTGVQLWRVAYTGTPDVAFVVGQAAADIDATGLLVNAADVTGGPCFVYAKNTTTTKVDVIFKSRQHN